VGPQQAWTLTSSATSASPTRPPTVRTWLAAHSRFHRHFTLTSSSWHNLVERWLAELTNKQLRRGVHGSVRALDADMRTWIATWNSNPKPYVWTKTSDEILERRAGYLNQDSLLRTLGIWC
jgi:hypothetical protein